MNVDETGRADLLTLAPLPVTVFAALARAITTAAASCGWRDVCLSSGMRVTGLPAPAGTPTTMHVITVAASTWHPGMATWSCSCGADDDRSYADAGRAVGIALGHVPAGCWWTATADPQPDPPAALAPTTPATDDELPVARGRREALDAARAALATELRGAPHNAPARSQLTYVGGLARARRILESLYVDARTAEETLVLAPREDDLR